MNKNTLEYRFLNDSAFNRAVMIIQAMINEDTGLTSLDIRDAAYLARLRHEICNVRPIITTPNYYPWDMKGSES